MLLSPSVAAGGFSSSSPAGGDFTFSVNNIGNEREYLKSIWNRLGVGCSGSDKEGGYLNRKELGEVCECIGMEKLPDEVGHKNIWNQIRI